MCVAKMLARAVRPHAGPRGPALLTRIGSRR